MTKEVELLSSNHRHRGEDAYFHGKDDGEYSSAGAVIAEHLHLYCRLRAQVTPL